MRSLALSAVQTSADLVLRQLDLELDQQRSRKRPLALRSHLRRPEETPSALAVGARFVSRNYAEPIVCGVSPS